MEEQAGKEADSGAVERAQDGGNWRGDVESNETKDRRTGTLRQSSN